MTFRLPVPELLYMALWFPVAFATFAIATFTSIQFDGVLARAFVGCLIVGASVIVTRRTMLTVGEHELQVCNGFRSFSLDGKDMVSIDIGFMAVEAFPRGVEIVTPNRLVPVRATQRFTQQRAQAVLKALEDFAQRNGVPIADVGHSPRFSHLRASDDRTQERLTASARKEDVD